MIVGVIGAGTMGSGIAQAFAMTDGYEVRLCDIKEEFAEGGKKKIEKNIAEMEDMAFEGLGTLKADPAVLNAYTAKIYEEAAARWSRMEEEFWMAHGRGF